MQRYAGRLTKRMVRRRKWSRGWDHFRPRDSRPTNGTYRDRVAASADVNRARFARFVARVLVDAHERGMSDDDIAAATGVGSSTFHRWQKALLAAAGVRDARVHDGRHTAATVLLALGVKIEVVQELLGHSDIRLTRGYAKVASRMAREATDRIGSALLRKPGTP